MIIRLARFVFVLLGVVTVSLAKAENSKSFQSIEDGGGLVGAWYWAGSSHEWDVVFLLKSDHSIVLRLRNVGYDTEYSEGIYHIVQKEHGQENTLNEYAGRWGVAENGNLGFVIDVLYNNEMSSSGKGGDESSLRTESMIEITLVMHPDQDLEECIKVFDHTGVHSYLFKLDEPMEFPEVPFVTDLYRKLMELPDDFEWKIKK